ncbi:MAG: VanW family protein [Candidatus Peribacteraceae bacterium]|nr:VanW family protein [Candidatus Peribacteraceae bacterium]
MKNTHKSLLARVRFDCEELAALLGIALLLFCGVRGAVRLQSDSLIGSFLTGTQGVFAEGNPQTERIADRLGKRLAAKGIRHSQAALSNAVATRQVLLKRKTDVQIRHGDGTQESWQMSVAAEPLLVRPVFSQKEAAFELDAERIRQMLQERVGELVPPVDARITGVEERDGFLRITTDGVAKEGDVLDEAAANDILFNALQDGTEHASLIVQRVSGQLINETERDLGQLMLLGTGRSNFAGSTWARSQNVRKALREHVNNTLVTSGATFSFNQTLERPVTTGNGWYMAKVIVNGVDLVMAPGGGICQASTTVFRAMTNAGFTAEERKAHSLYVTYYEEYGVGIDATVFPGAQDLTFVNDTGNYLIVQAYDDGYDAVVNIYGTSDGRRVKLEGPFFSGSAPEQILQGQKKLSSNDIAWLQGIEYADGSRKENLILSRYRAIPRSLPQKYLLHAGAGEES